jgi:hypothetical protein
VIRVRHDGMVIDYPGGWVLASTKEGQDTKTPPRS